MHFYETLTPLIFFLTIFTLHNIVFNKHGFISTPWPHIKVTIMLFVFGSSLLYDLYINLSNEMMSTMSPSILAVDTTGLILCHFEYIVNLYFVYKHRNGMCSYYYNYDQMDVIFKIKNDNNIKFRVTTLLVILLSCWLIASVGQFSTWASTVPWLSLLTYAFSYFMTLIRILTALDLISQIMHMQLRLKCICDHIEEIASFSDNSANRIKTIRNKTENENKLMACISKCRCEIGKTSSCYLLLIEQGKFLNRFFGVRMLMHCLYTLTEMITSINYVARIISGALSAQITSYVLLAPIILRLINCLAVLAILVHYSETCGQESGNIVDAIDHLLINKTTSEEVQSSLKSLRKLITSRPLKFSAAGFFNLDSTLLLSIASAVITYALVIVQSTQ